MYQLSNTHIYLAINVFQELATKVENEVETFSAPGYTQTNIRYKSTGIPGITMSNANREDKGKTFV